MSAAYMRINNSCFLFYISDIMPTNKSKGVKGWEATFLIRAFDLSEELSTEVGFAFPNNGLKSQDLPSRMKKIFQIFSLNSYHTFDITTP